MDVITLLYEIYVALGIAEWLSDWLSELLNNTLFAMIIRELVLLVTSEPGFPRLRYSAVVSDVTTWNSVFTVTKDGVY
jgi:hypothetical protein